MHGEGNLFPAGDIKYLPPDIALIINVFKGSVVKCHSRFIVFYG